ncbi:50S ribosomal protein L3 N(5)-glutamine methyltransferase [Sinimarinibacterium sp. NLF-5-8]|uniref:50S ribosomal protein L3 N(5)-glutamine methyltransferase n=1 Tax=Sinimarinibacterium sp. NLF-5-8 TaxID=2698684 RepID=UPI00137B979B|nr:50S ribosomal protein L3 N(5)-glutamine methyltransferase [Sinimarinibacterium sp. NLF-5-8]QHS09181.1 50S ribosomal protein L3 N(5)-glutamine methyltransferase [Sinimarinibacterium sp. NLF-5-8]
MTTDTDALRSVRDLIRWGASRFNENQLVFGHGTDNALDEAFYLVLHALHLPTNLPTVYLEASVTAREREAVLKLLKLRISSRKPAAYLLGEIDFAGLTFNVDERVLVPRSPIGEIIDRGYEPWLPRAPERILDLCTGSGCIGIASALLFDQAQVDLADLSSGALAVARSNIKKYELDARVRALKSDVYQGLEGARYDLIVTNPPYVPAADCNAMAAEFKNEPRMALEAGNDGMDIVARILAGACDHLTDDGVLICEVGGSVAEFEARWPRLPVTWVEFERGGDGVFVINRAALQEAL